MVCKTFYGSWQSVKKSYQRPELGIEDLGLAGILCGSLIEESDYSGEEGGEL